MRSFGSASAGLFAVSRMSGRAMYGSSGPGPAKSKLSSEPGDVRVRLLTEVGARVARQLLLLVGVVEQVHELVHGRLVALLLEERPGVLVERDAEERRLLVLHRARVGARRAVVVPHREGLVVERRRRRRSSWSNSQSPMRHQTSATYFGSCPGSTFGCGIIAQSLRIRIVEGRLVPRPLLERLGRRVLACATSSSTPRRGPAASATTSSTSGSFGSVATGYA